MMRCKDAELFAQLVGHAQLSQAEVARRVGMSKGYLSEIRHGIKGVDETDARAIARLLGVRASALFDTEPRTRRRKVAS